MRKSIHPAISRFSQNIGKTELKAAHKVVDDFLSKWLNNPDIGAFDGRVSKSFIEKVKGQFGNIWLVEPDSNNRNKMQALLGEKFDSRINMRIINLIPESI